MTTNTETFLTEEEFCARYRISRDGAYRLRHEPLDPLPCIKVGRRYLYDPGKVEAWAERRAELAREGGR